MVEICFDVIIHGEKDHADTIAHIGLAPGTVAAAIQTMAGLPGIFLAGHLQKIAGKTDKIPVLGIWTGFKEPARRAKIAL